MIFSLKQGMYTAVLLGEKTLTTRLKLPAHIANGKEWAIVPGRAKPAWWFRMDDGVAQVETDPRGRCTAVYGDTSNIRVYPASVINRLMFDDGWTSARIHIETFYDVDLQDMTHSEALRESVKSVEEYAQLWDRINDKKGLRWTDNPHVYRISFRLPDDVSVAVSRVGRGAILEAAGLVADVEKMQS